VNVLRARVKDVKIGN